MQKIPNSYILTRAIRLDIGQRIYRSRLQHNKGKSFWFRILHGLVETCRNELLLCASVNDPNQLAFCVLMFVCVLYIDHAYPVACSCSKTSGFLERIQHIITLACPDLGFFLANHVFHPYISGMISSEFADKARIP